MLSMMNISEQVGFSLVLGVGRIDNNNYMDIYTAATYAMSGSSFKMNTLSVS